jgi:hypothetical protein
MPVLLWLEVVPIELVLLLGDVVLGDVVLATVRTTKDAQWGTPPVLKVIVYNTSVPANLSSETTKNGVRIRRPR